MEDHIILRPLDRSLKKRKSRIRAQDRVNCRCSKQTYPYVYDYAAKHDLYIEEATDALLRIGLRNIHFPDGVPRRERILSRGLQLLKGQFRTKFTPLPLSKPKLKIADTRNRVLHEKPGEE